MMTTSGESVLVEIPQQKNIIKPKCFQLTGLENFVYKQLKCGDTYLDPVLHVSIINDLQDFLLLNG